MAQAAQPTQEGERPLKAQIMEAIEHEVASADVEKSSVSDKGGVEAGDGITVAQLPKSQ